MDLEHYKKQFRKFGYNIYIYEKLIETSDGFIVRVDGVYDHIRICHPTKDEDLAELYPDKMFKYRGSSTYALRKLLKDFYKFAKENILEE